MTQHGYYQSKADLQKRLNRAEGQLRGISRMIENDTYCIDILTQVSAAQAALNKVALELIKDHARHCMAETNVKNKQQKADELTNALARLLR